jgi:predicted ABC-type exoprotein transport system permease subunit
MRINNTKRNLAKNKRIRNLEIFTLSVFMFVIVALLWFFINSVIINIVISILLFWGYLAQFLEIFDHYEV